MWLGSFLEPDHYIKTNLPEGQVFPARHGPILRFKFGQHSFCVVSQVKPAEQAPLIHGPFESVVKQRAVTEPQHN